MVVKIQNTKEIRSYLAKELKELYREPEINSLANIIIKTIVGATRLHDLYFTQQPVSAMQSARIYEICKKLKTGKPIQYILGETIFYDCIIRVNSGTLIPRSETEELVDLIIRENRGFRGKILDIGSGSGCIAIALAANIPASTIWGVDISEDANRIAKENAVINKVSVRFFKGDIFKFDTDMIENVDIIVSNPPYVRNSEKQFMSKNVLDFEPPISLFVDDSEPLVYYEAILKVADNILTGGGRLYFEINEAMGIPVTQLLKKKGFSNIEIIKDLNGKDRIVKGEKDV